MAQIFYTDGREEQVTPENGKTFTLEELQKIVGGYVQLIDLGEQFMVVDEEGKIKRQKRNEQATAIFRARTYTMYGDYIVGVALICDKEMIE